MHNRIEKRTDIQIYAILGQIADRHARNAISAFDTASRIEARVRESAIREAIDHLLLDAVEK